ncbi:MAG TPA: hypothetical protein DGG94_09780, partial [Micromonosporaceae bacterium]|nr:hypothetical protein [Micromonosporaceae bacterium]
SIATVSLRRLSRCHGSVTAAFRLTVAIDKAMTLTAEAKAAGARLSEERGAETASALLKAEADRLVSSAP